MTDAAKRSDLSETARTTRTSSAGWMVQRLARRLNAAGRSRMAALDLTMDQFILLMTVAEADGVSQAVLGERVNLAGYTVTRALDALSARGLVERRPDPASRRAHLVVLTADGQALMPQLFRLIVGINADFLAPLDPAERKAFLATLGKLIAAQSPGNAAC